MDLSPQQVALLIAAAEAPEGSDARSQLAAVLGALEPLPQRPWTQFPIRSVVEFVLWSSGHQKEAIQLVAQSVATSGLDDVARHVFQMARRQFYDLAILALHHRRPDLAKQCIDAANSEKHLEIGPEEAARPPLADHALPWFRGQFGEDLRAAAPFDLGLSEREAERKVMQVERERQAFIRRHYDRDVREPTLYDIVINTESIVSDAAADLVVAAYGAKFGRLPRREGTPREWILIGSQRP